MEILVGADPEIFVSKNDVPFSAHGLVAGTKLEPLKVKEGAVQVDGTALEFNIDPAKSEKEFVFRITHVMNQLEGMMQTADPSLKFNISPSVIYPKDVFESIPDDAKELGCEPDYNAYTGKMNPRPDSSKLAGLETMRTGAGHVHIGWTSGADPLSPEHFHDCVSITKALDMTLGLAAAAWDDDTRRSSLYGAPGAFRPKHYGLEYRSLSNAWLKSPELIAFVYKVAHRTVQAVAVIGSDEYKRMFSLFSSASQLRGYPPGERANYFDLLYKDFLQISHPMNKTPDRYDRWGYRRSPEPSYLVISGYLKEASLRKFHDFLATQKS